jgi:hypothetical protein
MIRFSAETLSTLTSDISVLFPTPLIHISIQYLNKPKKKEMGGACGTCGTEDRCIQCISGDTSV